MVDYALTCADVARIVAEIANHASWMKLDSGIIGANPQLQVLHHMALQFAEQSARRPSPPVSAAPDDAAASAIPAGAAHGGELEAARKAAIHAFAACRGTVAKSMDATIAAFLRAAPMPTNTPTPLMPSAPCWRAMLGRLADELEGK